MRYANTAWKGQRFQSRRDVDRFSEDIPTIRNHVAQINADTEFDPLLDWPVHIAFRQGFLDRHREIHRLDGTGNFGKKAVTRDSDDPAPMLCDPGLEQIETGRRLLVHAGLVLADKAAVALNVCEQNCRQLSVIVGRFLIFHGN